tara:strand:+ start:2254 stop:2778 length:525 start_codon:yes stop_codon:yes gene_type:complete
MAIKDMKGTVVKNKATMTGMMNQSAKKIEPANLSGMEKLFDKPAKEAPAPMEQPQDMGLLQKVENLTDEEKTILATVLSPSVSNALRKISPELAPLLDAAGKSEENVVIPVSMFKNYAAKTYGGDETQAVQSLITDMSGTKMETQPVPPDTQMAEQPDDMMPEEINQIDSGELI